MDEHEDTTPAERIRAAVTTAFDLTRSADTNGLGDFLSTDLAIRYALASQPRDERDPEMFDWLSQGERQYRKGLVEEVYGPFSLIAGLEPRAEFGEDAWTFFDIVASSLVEGLGLRSMLLPELDLTGALDGTEGERVPTSVLGACCEAIMHVFFVEKSEDD